MSLSLSSVNLSFVCRRESKKQNKFMCISLCDDQWIRISAQKKITHQLQPFFILCATGVLCSLDFVYSISLRVHRYVLIFKIYAVFFLF